MYISSKSKAFLIAALFLLAAFLPFAFAPPRIASATEGSAPENEITLDVINSNPSVSYLYLDTVSGFCAEEDGLYVEDSSRSYRVPYDGSGIEQLHSGASLREQAVLGDNVYMIEGGAVAIYNAETMVKQCDVEIWLGGDKLTPDRLAATENCVYALAENVIFRVYESGAERITEPDADLIDIGAAGENLYLLKNNGLYIYGEVEPLLAANGYCRLACGDGAFFLVTQAGGNNTHNIDRIDMDTLERSPFTAAASSEPWFFNRPAGIFSRYGGIYVADTYNNRVACLSGGLAAYPYDTLSFAVSVTVTLSGEVLAAYDNNKIANLSRPDSSVLSVGGSQIIKLAAGLDDTVYVLTNNSVIKTDTSLDPDESQILEFDNAAALGIKAGGGVYVFEKNGSGGVIKPADNSGGEGVTITVALRDFFIDCEDKLFGITAAGAFVVIGADGALIKDYSDEPAFSGRAFRAIALSSGGELSAYNDILLLENGGGNALLKLDGNIAGVAEKPLSGGDIPMPQGALAVGRVKYEAALFARPIESEIIYRPASGKSVLLRTDVAFDDMYLALIENSVTAELEHGYIYKSAVNVLAEAQPAATQGKVLTQTNVYKYPSLYAPKLTGMTLPKDSMVRLLPFASDYTDSGGRTWHRIDADEETDGYICTTIQTSFSRKGETIDFNATLKEDAVVYFYDKVNEKYIVFESKPLLSKGTQIKVEDPYDSSKPYTRVVFYLDDGSVIDLECYVESKFVSYDGPDIIKIVAICAVIITSIALLIILVLTINQKRKNSKQ